MASIDASSSRCPGYVVVALCGEIDETHAAWLARALPAAAAAPDSRVVVDLEGLVFIDCSGLPAVVSAWKQATSGPRLRPASLAPLGNGARGRFITVTYGR